MSLVVSAVAFWALVLATFAPRARRTSLHQRGAREWWLDGLGLLIQGLLVPLVAAHLLAPLWRALWPALEGRLELPAVVSFGLCLLGVDYLYYWNHRLLHGARLWSLHRVHHTLEVMDVLGTSRNSLWTSFLVVYVWATSLASFVLADATPYLAAVTLTAVLDLWRHSPLDPPPWLARLLGGWLVLPRDHAWHHAGEGQHGNYGANFLLWDRLHGTAHPAVTRPTQLGLPRAGTVLDELTRPWTLP